MNYYPPPKQIIIHFLSILLIPNTHASISRTPNWGLNSQVHTNTNLGLMARALRSAGVAGVPSTSSSTSLRFSTQQSPEETTGAPGIKGGGDCLGLVRTNCAPCPPPEMNTAGAAGGCEMIDSQCDNLFCDPLCLNTVIDCSIQEISDAQFAIISSDKRIEKALCSEFKAHACSEAMCCDKDDAMLQAWVEEDVYGTSFPEPLMLIEACQHNPLDTKGAQQICDDCKKAIKGKIDIKPFEAEDVCTPMNSYFGELHDPIGVKDKGDEWTPYNDQFGFPFIGAHQMFKQRCERLVEKIEGHLKGLKGSFEETACNCLGCCDPVSQCWFPIVESPE